MDESQEKNRQYKVKITEEQEGGVYTNAVSVHINNNECTVDFAFSLPGAQEPTLKLVARINMSHATAKSLSNVLTNAILDWENTQKKA